MPDTKPASKWSYKDGHALWISIVERCHSPNRRRWFFSNYGGKGIQVCKRWRRSPRNFWKDIGPRPSPEHVLCRKDKRGHYEPANVEWRLRDECGRRVPKRLRKKYRTPPLKLGDIWNQTRCARLLGIWSFTDPSRFGPNDVVTQEMIRRHVA